MKRLRLATLLVLSPSLLLADLTPDQRRQDFLQLATLYWKQYAPYEWKRDSVGFDMARVQPWLDRVTAAQTDVDYLEICSEYVTSLKDGHVFFRLPTNFQARIGLSADLYDGKVLIETVNTSQLPAAQFPVRAGDEVVSIDGKPVDEIVRDFSKVTGFGSNPRGERRYAAQFLFLRPQTILPRAADVGENAVVVVRHADGGEDTLTIPWIKTGEPLRTLGTFSPLLQRNPATAALAGEFSIPLPDGIEPWEKPLLEIGYSAAPNLDLNSGLLNFGSLAPIYQLPANFQVRFGRTGDPFVTGTYAAGSKRIGYVRFPNMSPGNLAAALQALDQEIAFLEANTDGLVVDVKRNTGGVIVYGHEIARRLIPQPFEGVGFELRATAARVANLSSQYEISKINGSPDWAVRHWENMLADMKTALSENRGRTGPLPLDMPSLYVTPAAVVYTKPIIVLIDEFSVSSADLFPALMQDSGRATLVGWRTAGMGGTNTTFLGSAFSEGSAGMTLGLMVRPKPQDSPWGPTRYIENVGVAPDIELDYMTRDNLLQNGRPFFAAFTNLLLERIQ